MEKLKGYFWGILSGASFGLIPLFTLPLIAGGMGHDSILFYRFGLAALIMGTILVVRGESFRINFAEFWRLLLLAVMYMASSMFLLWGYDYMSAGVATTIHFLYPVCVVLMMIFFGERPSLVTFGAVIMAVVGVAMLSASDGSSEPLAAWPIVIVVISAVAYAAYIIGIKKFRIGSVNGSKLTFYVLLLTAFMFLGKSLVMSGGIVPLGGFTEIFNVTMLAFVPTVVSNFSLIQSVKLIGSSRASILGACEPLTAVVVGVMVFGDTMTTMLALGMLLIISSVTTIVMKMK